MLLRLLVCGILLWWPKPANSEGPFQPPCFSWERKLTPKEEVHRKVSGTLAARCLVLSLGSWACRSVNEIGWGRGVAKLSEGPKAHA